MKGYLAFTKKEFVEQIRTYRLLICLSVFFLFGLMSPLLAKLLPEILSGMDLQGMVLAIPEATAMDAYAQFFKNITQMGIIVILLVFGGVISNELTKGTLINILAKGLGRHTVILAKYTAMLVLWTLALAFASLVNHGYTMYMFDTSDISNLLFSLFCLWLFGAFLLSLIILSSVLTGGNFGGLILTVVVLGGLLILDLFPKLEKVNPIYLSSHNLEFLTGALMPADALLPVLVTIALLIGNILVSISLFNHKKL
ncbi:MAG: ABC transporter permease subunit [Clostridiales bacterium]|jgi:ABC-2 type transport system permease protein|nr:ABC transporter permease subunit [Clostridiales bacterium]